MTYCGKEICIKEENHEKIITLSQNGFIDGRLENIKIDKSRAKDPMAKATPEELTDFRSVVGSLQWLSTQSRPDVAFEVNQLQKRVRDLRVYDLVRVNKCVNEVRKHRLSLKFYDLGETEIVVYHDASLFGWG